ncbi:MAG: hypothetical protein FJ217_04895 [Ignavibacteria bacterium]|nr:hypothetical protein [Ignavibacteria bacterium]
MRTSPALLIGLLSLFVFSGCEDSGPVLPLESSIEGQVYSISTPGPIPEDRTLPRLEMITTILVLDASRTIVKEFRTNAKGRFKTHLEPGTYFLRVKESRIAAETGPFVVKPSQMLAVEAHDDSGMR